MFCDKPASRIREMKLEPMVDYSPECRTQVGDSTMGQEKGEDEPCVEGGAGGVEPGKRLRGGSSGGFAGQFVAAQQRAEDEPCVEGGAVGVEPGQRLRGGSSGGFAGQIVAAQQGLEDEPCVE